MQNIINKNTIQKKAGFSLIEAMLALFVITQGLIFMMIMMTDSINVTKDSRDQIVATQLAQEGIELAKNYYDNSNPRALPAAGVYQADSNLVGPAPNWAVNFDAFTDGALYLNSSGYFFDREIAGTKTRFARKITVAGSSVTSMVWWSGGGEPAPCNLKNKCFSVRIQF